MSTEVDLRHLHVILIVETVSGMSTEVDNIK